MNQPSLFDDELPPIPNPYGFTEGENCPIPVRFPTGGARPQDIPKIDLALKARDVRALNKLMYHWWCEHCNHWHRFSERFFKEFKGKYSYELKSLKVSSS